MEKLRQQPNPNESTFVGKWRILEMEQWDADFIDAEGPGHIALKKKGTGEFHFGYISCGIDWEYDSVAGRVDFTFDGFDEMTPTNGRGWARIDGEQLVGEIAFHLGDRSGFIAKKG